MSIPRKFLVAAGVVAAVAFLGYQAGGSSDVDSPDGFDPLSSILGSVGGLFSMAAYAYSPAAIALVQRCEGCRLTAYRDSVGVLTIGWGHTGHDVYVGQTITQAQADALLAGDLQTAANLVNNGVNVDVTQPQFDAMTSFAYNVGGGNFLGSTLLKMVNAGDFGDAAGQFSRWTHAGGVVLSGLVTRRALEAALFTTPGASASGIYVATADTTGTGPIDDGEDA